MKNFFIIININEYSLMHIEKIEGVARSEKIYSIKTNNATKTT